ncbi:MAG: hypothetical protein ACRD2O_10610, partial [Terriglobia bacterium]
ATLVYLAKRESLSVILTIDHADFATYRIEGKRKFRVLPLNHPWSAQFRFSGTLRFLTATKKNRSLRC